MRAFLTAIFVSSGAAGLIYESIWSRYLGLLVGHSADAQVLVLMIFLGGMSAGAAIAAARSARLANPLRAYALIELLVGAYGFAFHDLFTRVTALAYDRLLPAIGGTMAVPLTMWLLAALLILPPSLLLGATFPLMSAAVLRRTSPTRTMSDDSGRIVGLLYFANSLGAAGGVLLAGFWLIEAVGLPGTLMTAGALNLAAALGSWGVLRTETESEEGPGIPPQAPAPRIPPAPTEDAPDRAIWRTLLAVSFGTAVASFCYEIGWIRLLTLVLGGATHAFELMLSAFILGLALGALAVGRWIDRDRDPVRTLGWVQWVMGTTALLTLGLAIRSFDWMAALFDAVARTDGGYRLFNLARYGIALGVMLPTTICAGMTLPIITRALLGAGHGERAIGAVYAWNTLGSIVGVAGASLVLMPALGLRGVLILGGAIDLALGCWLLWRYAARRDASRPTGTLAAVGAIAVVAATLLGRSFDPNRLASGVFRYGTTRDDEPRSVVFYRDGRTASVSIRSFATGTRTLSTNGKPDASLSRIWSAPLPVADSLRQPLVSDEATQLLLPTLSLAYAPSATRAAIIGFGSGMSAHTALGNPALQQLVTIEIEPLMVEAARQFQPANQRVFTDGRSRIVHEDARAFFAASTTRYDLIVSEPSNPWVSGVSGLFTDEFYGRVRRALAPGGVFGQWLHLYEIDDALVLSVLAALHRNFPSYVIHFTNNKDLLIVASGDSALRAPDWSVLARPGIADDLSRFLPLSAAVLDATIVATRAELAPLLDAATGLSNSDFAPSLDLGAERTRFLRRTAIGMSAISTTRFDLMAAIGGRSIALASPTTPVLQHPRITAQAVGRALRDGMTLAPIDADLANRGIQQARLRSERLARELASSTPPADWFSWFTELLVVESDRHLGTMGQVDTVWYDAVESYLRRASAPAEAIAAVRFLRAAVTYDWARAAPELPALLAAWSANRRWLPAEFLLQAGTLTRIRVDDRSGAKQLLSRIWRATGWAEDDLRLRVLHGLLWQREHR